MADSVEQDVEAVQGISAVPTMLDILCRTTGMRFAAVARVTEDRWVACSVRDDIAFGLKPGGELKVESTICHEIRQSGQAVIIDSVADDPAYRGHHTPLTYGLQSYISMPIRLSDGSFFGTLCAIDPEPRRLNTPEIIKTFEMFAEVIGYYLSAVDRLHGTEARLLDERKTAALREQFIAVLGHDLRNPLAAIDAGTRILQATTLTEKAQSVLTAIQASVGRMAGLIDNVMDFARGRLGGGLTLQRSAAEPLEPVLRQVVAELQASAPHRRIEAQYALHVPVYCDTARVAQLVSNLLGNAATYGARDQPIRLSATTTATDLEVVIANGGQPIPPAVLDSIFEPFSRGALSSDLQGLGLGLYIVKTIAQAHGGDVTVASSPRETRFTFRMPLHS